MPITHQEIAERMDALNASGVDAARVAREAYETKVGAEQRSLRELCAGLGHVARVHNEVLYSWRGCVICGERLPDQPTGGGT